MAVYVGRLAANVGEVEDYAVHCARCRVADTAGLADEGGEFAGVDVVEDFVVVWFYFGLEIGGILFFVGINIFLVFIIAFLFVVVFLVVAFLGVRLVFRCGWLGADLGYVGVDVGVFLGELVEALFEDGRRQVRASVVGC